VKPRVQLHYLNYSDLHIIPSDLASGVSPNSSNTFIPLYDVDSGLIFERNFRNDWTQTLEPKLYYLYVPTINQNDLPVFDSALNTFDYSQIWRDNRYTGLDRVSEANQISFGLASKIYNNHGEEVAMFGIGQIYYFHNILLLLDTDQDYTYKKWSPLAAVGSLRIAPEYKLTVNWVRFRESSNIFSVQFQYKPEPNRVFNFGYELAPNALPDDLTGRYNTDVQQLNLSTAWQLTPPLRFLGMLKYDLRFHRNMNTLIGVEYHTCCTEIRLLWNSVWESNISNERAHRNSFHIQFIFKGFAGIGNAKDSFIAAAIPGYTPVKPF
jgi:LPS-assembly protein